MAKVKQPLLSFDARRKLGDDIVFKRQGRTAIVETRPIPQDARSAGQLSWRHMFLKVVALWHALSAAEKEAWESLGRKRHMTGYAWFVSQALRPNPGIYLPLQGGIMTGDIWMGTNAIKGLPHPDGAGWAARRSYVDGRVAADILTHKGDAAAHHTRYADAEADARIAIHAAIAAAHHARYADAEAITAAKTVKLDDFTTPDDNADLNASITRHGLLKKLPNLAIQFLNGLGNWAVPAGEDATKEIYNSVHWGIEMGFAGSKVDGGVDQAGMVLIFPQDFTSITSLEIIFTPLLNRANMHFTITTRWAAYNGGEPVNVHTETENARDIGPTVHINRINHDISDLVDVVAPVKGDILQVLVDYSATAQASNAYIEGLRLKYT